jgi:hypothetical protein
MTIASRSGGRLESDSVALPLKSLDGPSPDAVGIPASVVVGAGFLIDGAAGQEVVRGNEHRVGNGDDRLFVPPVAEHTSVARTKRTVSRADRGEGRLDEGRAEPAATRAGLARLVFPGALGARRPEPGSAH